MYVRLIAHADHCFENIAKYVIVSYFGCDTKLSRSSKCYQTGQRRGIIILTRDRDKRVCPKVKFNN